MSGTRLCRVLARSAVVAVAAGVVAACASSPPQIRVKLAHLPATIRAGGGAVVFTGTLTNHSSVTESDVAPVFQLVGGPCNCVTGSLQRFDAAAGTWRPVPMPEGDGDPNFLARATGAVSLRPGASVTFRYRVTVSDVNAATSLRAVLYAVQLPEGTQLGLTSVRTRLIRS